MKIDFCTCEDFNCPNHPSNHNQGCALCIKKNLELNEIPSCFFKKINKDISKQEDFTIDGFVKFYNENNN